MIQINHTLSPSDLRPKLERFWQRSAECLDAIEAKFPVGSETPVLTVDGQYQARGWTEWTQGFQYGAHFLQFDATGELRFFDQACQRTVDSMASHLTHVGVHDHGFNNVSTYGNWWRLMNEGRVAESTWQRNFCELALKVTGAVQASRWAVTREGSGYIYSFNGPQSLFVDTIRSCRALALSHQLGHVLMGEQDVKINLLECLVEHACNTARYNIWYGESRDSYDIRGRTAHESIFNAAASGEYRCPSTQQGYSPFSTWTRGLAWAMLGYPEQLEWLQTVADEELEAAGGRANIEATFLEAARATCDFYLEHTPTCGVPYWDTGAPGLSQLGDYLSRAADPYNEHEPVDSSAAAIAAQGLLRLGQYLEARGEVDDAARYRQAGLTVLDTLLGDPYLSSDPNHQGLLLHSIYHRPNGWDYVPEGQRVPCGESSMWGDYHARELAVYVGRLAQGETYHTFFGPTAASSQSVTS
ncbi:MAG: glycosyl hydrolase [Planctomycetota bacterium]